MLPHRWCCFVRCSLRVHLVAVHWWWQASKLEAMVMQHSECTAQVVLAPAAIDANLNHCSHSVAHTTVEQRACQKAGGISDEKSSSGTKASPCKPNSLHFCRTLNSSGHHKLRTVRKVALHCPQRGALRCVESRPQTAGVSTVCGVALADSWCEHTYLQSNAGAVSQWCFCALLPPLSEHVSLNGGSSEKQSDAPHAIGLVPLRCAATLDDTRCHPSITQWHTPHPITTCAECHAAPLPWREG